ncbi:DUF533 domain-containing protein [Jannaschia donghaensis]|uniref:Inner membrane protein YebE n=1 Tax=Jannaschia donghaensis TaxID=420998 RepID=A0A0M6YP22_9RHOB|nr:DUF533 domain-containing protein [Jannaschia donghaensis]CTQ50997.1 Inner membrane protein YebE [Jannaschia donghaensis]
MSLKRMAMKMALAFAAAKGYQAFKGQGGMAGLKQKMSSGGTSAKGGGLAGMLGGLVSGSTAQGGSGGLGSMLGGLSGSGTSGSSSMGGMGGLLGGLAAMAGGTAMAGRDQHEQMAQAEAGPADEATAAAMIRAIGQAVRADGEIDDEERAALHDIMGDAESAQDRRAIEDALNEPLDPNGLARDVPIGSEAQVYAAALTAIDPDHPAEKQFLSDFARALRLDAGTIQQLHDTAGKPV